MLNYLNYPNCKIIIHISFDAIRHSIDFNPIKENGSQLSDDELELLNEFWKLADPVCMKYMHSLMDKATIYAIVHDIEYLVRSRNLNFDVRTKGF